MTTTKLCFCTPKLLHFAKMLLVGLLMFGLDVVNSAVWFLCNSQGSKTDVNLMSKWSTDTDTWLWRPHGPHSHHHFMVKSIFVYLCLRLWTLCRVGILSEINTKINHSVTGLKFSKFYFGKVKFFTPLEYEPSWSIWRTSAFGFSTRMWMKVLMHLSAFL